MCFHALILLATLWSIRAHCAIAGLLASVWWPCCRGRCTIVPGYGACSRVARARAPDVGRASLCARGMHAVRLCSVRDDAAGRRSAQSPMTEISGFRRDATYNAHIGYRLFVLSGVGFSSSAVLHLWAGEIREFNGVDDSWLRIEVVWKCGGVGVRGVVAVEAGIHLKQQQSASGVDGARNDEARTIGGGLGLGSVVASSK